MRLCSSFRLFFFPFKIGGPTRIRDEHQYISDIIQVALIPYKVKPSFIAKLYLEQGLSASQIAVKVGCSKTTVLEKLRSLDIKNGTLGGKKARSHYKTSNPPYGFHYQGSQLVPFPKEVRICRIVVKHINEEQVSFREVARRLSEKGFQNRVGKTNWNHTMVKTIYERWKDRL